MTSAATKLQTLKPRKDDLLTVQTDSASRSSSHSARGNWTGRLDFIMSLVSYAVGLGNIWRFPYLCYRNGGAVFLIPYIFFLFSCGMPMFFLEVSFGQFASLSPITIWRISPFFKGIGIGMVAISGIVCAYYNVINAWTLYFLFSSFAGELPWASCGHEWNTHNCRTECVTNTTINGTACGTESNSTNSSLPCTRFVSPSEEFWENHVLNISAGIDDVRGLRWKLLATLITAWLMVFFSLIKGIKSSGKVVYFTALFPYVVLICLLVRAVTLDGAYDGIEFYLIPKWDKLWTLQIWGEAAMQIFFSVGAAFGALITLASFNKFKNNCYRDACIVPLLNCSTSIFAGFVIFAVLGFMAKETCTTIENVVNEGPGLVFVAYPQAIAKFPLAQVWSILFFTMLFSVGMGSQLSMFQTVTNAFMDEVQVLRERKTVFLICMIVVTFCLGVPCITDGGIYFLQVLDWYSSTFSLMILSLSELIAICWVYGADRFYKDIHLMIGREPTAYWRILWRYLTPIIIVFVLGFSIADHTPVTYGDKDSLYEYPNWAIALGWGFALCSIVPVPIVALYKLAMAKGSLKERFKEALKSDSMWGPAVEKDFKRYKASLEKVKKPASSMSTDSETTCDYMETKRNIRVIDGAQEFPRDYDDDDSQLEDLSFQSYNLDIDRMSWAEPEYNGKQLKSDKSGEKVDPKETGEVVAAVRKEHLEDIAEEEKKQSEIDQDKVFTDQGKESADQGKGSSDQGKELADQGEKSADQSKKLVDEKEFDGQDENPADGDQESLESTDL